MSIILVTAVCVINFLVGYYLRIWLCYCTSSLLGEGIEAYRTSAGHWRAEVVLRIYELDETYADIFVVGSGKNRSEAIRKLRKNTAEIKRLIAAA